MKKSFLWIVIICFTFIPEVEAQISSEELTKLISSLPNSNDDTNKLKNLSLISEFCAEEDFPSYNEQMGKLAKKLMSSNNKDIIKLSKKYLADYYTNLGYIYAEQSDYNLSLANFDECIKLCEEVNDLKGLALAYSSVGAVYDRVDEKEKAIVYYSKAFEIAKKQKDYKNMAVSLHNLSVIYSKKNDFKRSYNLLKQVERIIHIHHLENSNFTPTTFLNLGNNALRLNDTLSALNYYHLSLDLSNRIKSNSGKSSALTALSKYNLSIGRINIAKKQAEESLPLSIDANDYKGNMETADILNNIYTQVGDYKTAHKYLILKFLNDSLYRAKENQKAVIRHQFKSEYDLKQAIEKAEQDKKEINQRNIRNSITGVLCGSLIFLTVVYRQRNKIAKAKKRSEELLLNILPYEVAEELKSTGTAEAKQIDSASVLFTDFKGFTSLSEKVSAKQLVKDLHECFTAFDQIMIKHGLEKIKTIGDSYMAAGGLPIPNNTNAVDAVYAAIDIVKFIEQTKLEKQNTNEPFFEIRIGVHTGPVVAGIVGIKKFSYDIWGDTVNTASRLESSSEPGRINISETTYELVKDKFECEYRGEIEAKGKGKIKMYFVKSLKLTN